MDWIGVWKMFGWMHDERWTIKIKWETTYFHTVYFINSGRCRQPNRLWLDLILWYMIEAAINWVYSTFARTFSSIIYTEFDLYILDVGHFFTFALDYCVSKNINSIYVYCIVRFHNDFHVVFVCMCVCVFPSLSLFWSAPKINNAMDISINQLYFNNIFIYLAQYYCAVDGGMLYRNIWRHSTGFLRIQHTNLNV